MSTTRKPHAAPWAGSPLCLDVVNVGTVNRKDGCPCARQPLHEGNHQCACGTEWDARQRLVGPATYAAICGWNQRPLTEGAP